jgi:hypothetical protein
MLLMFIFHLEYILSCENFCKDDVKGYLIFKKFNKIRFNLFFQGTVTVTKLNHHFNAASFFIEQEDGGVFNFSKLKLILI